MDIYIHRDFDSNNCCSIHIEIEYGSEKITYESRSLATEGSVSEYDLDRFQIVYDFLMKVIPLIAKPEEIIIFNCGGSISFVLSLLQMYVPEVTINTTKPFEMRTSYFLGLLGNLTRTQMDKLFLDKS